METTNPQHPITLVNPATKEVVIAYYEDPSIVGVIGHDLDTDQMYLTAPDDDEERTKYQAFMTRLLEKLKYQPGDESHYGAMLASAANSGEELEEGAEVKKPEAEIPEAPPPSLYRQMLDLLADFMISIAFTADDQGNLVIAQVVKREPSGDKELVEKWLEAPWSERSLEGLTFERLGAETVKEIAEPFGFEVVEALRA